ncbi:hypothetical protein [Snuella sedimenti]|uniref:Uncharacterized protein n=1 Tax=Snuella sedimenti TaxID=2798802 RepID=A0A8J7LUB3_9FLAO|nr:hypothetical protein [Snuella sedimenti]MBJ6369555.1 hypothetical protein [Snuella sedimenti]
MNTITHINTTFTVTKKVSNPNGFLLPNILYNRIKAAALMPVKEFYLHAIPEFTDYKFKMHKNAFLNDNLTIQTQLVKQDANGYLVNIMVTKAKKASNRHETICTALFGFPLEKYTFQQNKTAC